MTVAHRCTARCTGRLLAWYVEDCRWDLALLAERFRFGAVNGWVANEEGAQARDGGEGLVVEAEEVGDEALVEVDAGGVDGAAVEGLEGSVLEVAPDGLGLVELPGLELTHDERGERYEHFSITSRPQGGSPIRVVRPRVSGGTDSGNHEGCPCTDRLVRRPFDRGHRTGKP